MILNCIILDDEPFARRDLETLIRATERLQLLSSFDNASKVLDYLIKNGHKIAILFLDIEMLDMDGMELAYKIREWPELDHIQLVFITGHADFAQQSYRVDAADYLLKPIIEIEFQQAVERCRNRTAAYHYMRQKKSTSILIKNVKNGMRAEIQKDNIVYLNSMEHYVKLFTDETSCVIFLSFKKAFTLLADGNFIQIRRNTIINLNKVVNFNYKTVELTNGEVLPIGQTFQKAVNRLLKIRGNGKPL